MRQRSLILVLLLLLASLPVPATTRAALPSSFYVDETGQVIAEPFLSRWAARGGQESLGLPISGVFKYDGSRAQLFQLGALREKDTGSFSRIPAGSLLAPALAPRDRDVAGRRVAGDPAAGFAQAADASLADAIVDEKTGFAIAGPFLEHYGWYGGRPRFGRPISSPYRSAGKTVQWFQYARLEWDDARGAMTEAPIGFELAHLLGVETREQPRGALPSLDLSRFVRYGGDGTIPEAQRAFTPVRIAIPSIGIDAVIEEIEIDKGIMGVPEDAWNVGWYGDLPRPGERTNVVMAAHRDWWGIGPVVFYRLEEVRPGDRVYVTSAKGTGATYEVLEIFQVDAGIDATPLIDDQGGETLTLITCGGAFNGVEYLNRWIVRAKRI